MSCPPIHRTLAEGAPLSPAERHHVDGCAECAAVVERYGRYREAVDAVDAVDAPAAGGDFSARVLAQLDSGPDPFEVVAWAAWRGLPLAAALALVLGLWTALLPEPQGPDFGVPLAADDAALVWLLQSAAEDAP